MTTLEKQKEIYREEYKEQLSAYTNNEGDVIIEGEVFTASEILEEIGKEAFDAGLVEFIQRLKDDHSSTVINFFPAPVSYYYRRAVESFYDINDKKDSLRSTWEAIVYILYAIVLGEINATSYSIKAIKIFNGQKIKLDKHGLLSWKFGYKLEVIKKIIEDAKANSKNLLLAKHVDLETIEKIEELIVIRNDFAHHGSQPEALVENKCDQMLSGLNEILFDFDLLFKKVSILKFSAVTNSIGEVRFNKFDGYSLLAKNHDEKFDGNQVQEYSNILNNDIILIKVYDDLFNVSPFIHFCYDRSEPKLYYYKEEDNSGNFIFEKIGGTIVDDIALPKNSLQKGIHNTLDRLL